MIWLIIILVIMIFIISPLIRNYMKFKEGEKLENNIGGFLIKKIFKK